MINKKSLKIISFVSISGWIILTTIFLYLAYVPMFDINDHMAKEHNRITEYESSYSWPDKLPEKGLLKCSSQIKGNVIFYEKSYNHVVYVVDNSTDLNTLYLEDSDIIIFSKSCDLLEQYSGTNEKLEAATSINSLELHNNVLLMDYHVGPHGGIVRRFDIKEGKERYFMVYYPQSVNPLNKLDPVYVSLDSKDDTWKELRDNPL